LAFGEVQAGAKLSGWFCHNVSFAWWEPCQWLGVDFYSSETNT